MISLDSVLGQPFPTTDGNLAARHLSGSGCCERKCRRRRKRRGGGADGGIRSTKPIPLRQPEPGPVWGPQAALATKGVGHAALPEMLARREKVPAWQSHSQTAILWPASMTWGSLDQPASVTVWVSIVVIKYHSQKQLGEDRSI